MKKKEDLNELIKNYVQKLTEKNKKILFRKGKYILYFSSTHKDGSK